MSFSINANQPTIQPYVPATPPSQQDKNVALAKVQVNHHQQMAESYMHAANANSTEQQQQTDPQESMQKAVEFNQHIIRSEALNTVLRNDPIANRYEQETIDSGIVVDVTV